MTTPAEGTATPAPTTNTTAANAPPPIPAGLSATPQPPDESQPWFKERLERAAAQEREKLLAEIGAKDPKAAKAAVEAANKAAEEAKTVTDKLTDATKAQARAESEAERLRKISQEWAARQMLGLTEEQRKAVTDLAGDDASEQLRAITALAPTWAKAATQTQALPATPATGTAPPPHAPEGGPSTSPPNHQQVHAALLKTNPIAAAEYAIAHVRDVFPDQPTS
jgi:hypothetical protein